MNRGIVLIILGVVIIVSLFIVDIVASRQVFGPPYSYEYDPDSKTYDKYATFYPERGSAWVQGYYRIDKILWSVGLPLTAIFIGLGCWYIGKVKSGA
jgi:hypothetical protein